MALHVDQITGPLPSNRVGDVVYERILDAIHYGELRPGERLSDQEIARRLGVSRTPVRETLLRLQVMGVVEIAAARYTRVAMVSRQQTVEAVRVWAALYRLVVSEVFPSVSPELLERMTAAADAYRELAARSGGNGPVPTEESVIANADFFWAPVAASDNTLQERDGDRGERRPAGWATPPPAAQQGRGDGRPPGNARGGGGP